MGIADQKKYTTRLQEIENGVLAFTEETVGLLDEVKKRMDAIEDSIRAIDISINETIEHFDRVEKTIHQERTHHLELAKEQRSYVDQADKRTDWRLDGFVGRGFWSRLNWLLTGR